MTDTNVDIDDISLIKAFGVLGRECERKIDNLVQPLGEVVANAIPSIGERMHQASLFKGNRRSVVHASLSRGLGHPKLFVGVVLGNSDDPSPTVCVWIETPPNDPAKSRVQEKLKQVFPELQTHGWKLGGTSGWADIMKSVSMKHLIGAEDQQAWMRDFTEKAIGELKAAGVVDGLRSLAK